MQQARPVPLRKAHIKSFGCQMNVYDAQRMEDVLAQEGYGASARAEDAELVILNTCHIREKAAEKVYSELGRLRQAKAEAEKSGRTLSVIVAGCVAQAEGAEIIRRAGVVDAVVGPQSYHHLPDILRRTARGEQVVDTEFPADDKFDHLAPVRGEAARQRGISAFVTVQEGCDKFCTFCVVPYTRGMETSRPAAAVRAEVERLAAAGVREVTLIGQNVNAYHGEDGHGGTVSLGGLIRMLAQVPGIARLRYTTSHPRDIDDDLLRAHADVPAVMPFMHLPVQSGSDRVLAAMNRKHTAADYDAAIARLRGARPDIALSSDFIVGFPGETEEDFRATLDLVERTGFAAAYSFKYSARAGTPAAEMDGMVPEDVMDERLARLQATINRHQTAFNRQCVGRTLDVLFEKPGRHEGQIAGRSPYLQPVPVLGPATLIGKVAQVAITGIGPNSLTGTLVGADTPHALAGMES